MKISTCSVWLVLMFSVFSTGLAMADPSSSQVPNGHGTDTKLPHGVIGVVLQIGAERIGDPAILYIGMVHPEGPAHQAGLQHGDEVVSVNDTAVTGKNYEQVVGMVRGEPGTVVKLGVRGENGLRELSVTRVAGEKLPKGPAGMHGSPAR